MIWKCFGCSYHCKCVTEDYNYCVPKKCVAFELSIPDWRPVAEEKDGKAAKQKAD